MFRFLSPGRCRVLAYCLLVASGIAFGLPLRGIVQVARAADSSTDIPGIPLPGPIAAGRLGGAIYDVVYRLQVERGNVIVASLTGTEGTDFDLYLFDGSATTVLSTTGLLTKSAGPTSTESISWPAAAAGTFYIDLNGATNVEGDYRLTVQTVPDATAPTVSMVLANGKPATNQNPVPVRVQATDDLSGVAEMAFSSDGVTFEPWQPYQVAASWTFPPGDGPHTLWVKVRNGVGLESSPARASVVIDTVAPIVTGIDPAPGAAVAGLRPTVTLTFNEAIDPSSWLDLGLVMQAASGALIAGDYAYDSAARKGTFVPRTPLQPGALYVVTVGNVRDTAGNLVVFPGSWSVTPLSPTSITAVATPTVILPGGSSRISLNLSGATLPATIEVSSAVAPGGFVDQMPIPTTDGSNTLIVAAGSNTIYRFHYPGTSTVAASVVDVRVLVRRSIVLANSKPTVTSRTSVGRLVKLTALVGPTAAGVPVSFKLYRFVPSRRAWVYAGSHGRNTDASGRASFTWIPASPGQYYWRATVASTATYVNNVSPVYRWSVSR
jgi:hypothetical protein